MMNPRIARLIRTALVPGAAALLVACSSSPSVNPDPTRPDDAQAPASYPATNYSGFLHDYSKLRPSPRHPDTLYEQSERLAGYDSFIVEPITFLPERTVRGTTITTKEAADLCRALREETVTSLSVLHPVGDTPGPRVAVIRAAITALAAARVDPVTGQILIGGATVEVEILDSLTRERLAAAIESDVVRDAAQPVQGDPYSDARLVFGHWAARLNMWLRDAAELATRP